MDKEAFHKFTKWGKLNEPNKRDKPIKFFLTICIFYNISKDDIFCKYSKN